MSRLDIRWPGGILAVVCMLTLPIVAYAGFSVDEDPRETPADPGDVFFPFLVCDMDDGDGNCPLGTPSLNIPNPGPDDDPTFDMDALAVDLPLEVCPPDPPYPPGILFSIDDGDPGPGAGAPDNSTEVFFYDHCQVLGPRSSYHTSITEDVLGLLADPPPRNEDDDVDAFETRPAGTLYLDGNSVLFSPDFPSTGGLGTPNPQAHVWFVNLFLPAPVVWADAGIDIGVPDPGNCDIDGIARIFDPDSEAMLLFTTDAEAPCGLDPGDIYVTDLIGGWALYADDVNDLGIAASEGQEVDIDALAINDGGDFNIGEPYFPPDRTVYKADWPNYAPSGLPDFSQDHASFPPTWCGPTALADSLWWFDSEMECDRDLTIGANAESEPNDTPADADPLGERPPIAGTFLPGADPDWYEFEIPGKPYRTCTVTVSTCALRQPGDADTVISLYGDPFAIPIAVNDNGCPPALQSEVTREVAAGSRYFVKVEPPPVGPGAGTTYTLSLGVDCYRMVERHGESPDDHSEYNPVALVPDLASCMNTDDVLGTGSGHKGTRLPDMEVCFDNYSTQKGLRQHYENVVALMPPFVEVAREVERSEDVLLLLGFWFDLGGQWFRCGGHYVTSAGVDFAGQTISLSDPGLNNAETGAPGRVRGPDHLDHAPAINPPPDHDDTLNVSHDRYAIGPSSVPFISQFSLSAYATGGLPTTCADVARWCLGGFEWGQNPAEPPLPMEACPDPGLPVSVEVEAMFDVSPRQTPICVFLDLLTPWPDNLRIDKGPCNPMSDNTPKDLIRGKMCNLRFAAIAAQVDLGWVQCLYNDSDLVRFDELSPDDTQCTGGWFYLVRESPDPNYGDASGGEPRVPFAGGCP